MAKSKGKGKGKKDEAPVTEPVVNENPTDEGNPPADEGNDGGGDGAEPKAGRILKNHVDVEPLGADGDGFTAFVSAFGDMGRDFKGGYETHYNNDGPMCRKGVERITNQGLAKNAAIFLDVLAERAANVGVSNHGLPTKKSPEDAETILNGIYSFLGDLIESKREAASARKIAAMAKSMGISVEEVTAFLASKGKLA